VEIAWDTSEVSEPIKGIRIEVRHQLQAKDKKHFVELSKPEFCEKTTKPDFCSVKMDSLAKEPFNLADTDPIEIRVKAYNYNGEGPWADTETTGQLAVLLKPQMEGNLRYEKEGSERLRLSWSDRRSPRTSYNVFTHYNPTTKSFMQVNRLLQPPITSITLDLSGMEERQNLFKVEG